MLAALFLTLCASTDPDAATLSKTRLPTQGAQSSILTVKRFGRFALTAKSKQGASVQLVDRANGPGVIAGAPGTQDGRLDLFLDRGDFKVLTRGAEGKDELELTVHPFREKNGNKPPMLVELKPIDETLADFEQRSYWIDIEKRRTIFIEAGGRSLSDLRLFKDGIWLIDALPVSSRAEPKATQPLRVLQLTVDLEPGLYLLTAYGGPKEPWADDEPRTPFHLRYGVPRLPEAGRKHFKVGPFGYDRYLVPNATYFRLELPEAKPARLEVNGQRQEINKTTLPPVTELYSGGSLQNVVVTAEAGQPYILQNFDMRHRLYLSTPGHYYVSSITAGHAEDSLDTTAVAIAYNAGPTHVVPSNAAVVEVDSKKPWIRKFNLLAKATVFLRVSEAGKYRLTTGAGGATANWRIEPMFINPPPDYRVPAFQPAPGTIELDEGYWVLTLEPTKKGILEIALKRQQFGSSSASKLPLTGMRVPSMYIPSHGGYWLWLNEQPGVQGGLLIRSLPLDLREPIYALQNPEQDPLSFDFVAQEAGMVRAEAEDGSAIPISVDGRDKALFVRVETGKHTVTVHPTGKHLVAYSLGLTPRRLEKDTPLPQLPDARLAGLPDFPLLTSKNPRFLDLQRNSAASFLLHADKPGLYRVESSGLLETSGTLRTRMITRLAHTAANGVGRNFLLEQYLGTGDYQVTVATQGMTRGRLGVQLGETRVIQGGALREGIVARTTLPTGNTAIFPFEITSTGIYHLRAIAPGRILRARIEDADGWPLLQPGSNADVQLELEPGKYRIVVLPEPVEVRVLAILKKERDAISFQGKGPHALPFDTSIEHTWHEVGRRESRKPDVFTFELPARANVNIALSDSMRGDLVRLGPKNARERVAQILRGGWQGTAEKGNYRLEISCLHENEGVDYELSVQPVPFVAGITRELYPPASVQVAIGDQRAVEISSFGSDDVRARLFDTSGRIVAESDDRPDDWNFLIAARVPPGEYRLQIDPVGARTEESQGNIQVTMSVRGELAEKPETLPFKKKLELGDHVRLIPFEAPAAPLLALSAASQETIGLSLEAEIAPDQWKTVALRVGRPAKVEALAETGIKKYRARVWSADRRGLPANISIAAISPKAITEEDLLEGVTLSGSDGVVAASVSLVHAGTLRLLGAPEGSVRMASVAGDAFEPLDRDMARAESKELYLVRDLAGDSVELRAERVRLGVAAAALDIAPDRSLFADLPEINPGVPLLVEAEAIGSSIGVAFGTKTRDLAQIAIRDRAAIAVTLTTPETPVARIWSLDQQPAPVEVRARAMAFDLPPATSNAGGLSTGSLSKRSGHIVVLPAGAKRIRLTLEDGAVAVIADEQTIERVVWADDGEEVVETAAAKVFFLNPTEKELRWSAELVGQTKVARTILGERRPYEALRPLAGVVRLEVAAGKTKRTIHVRGEVESALYVGTGGASARGRDLAIDAQPGVLYLRTKPGLVVAWIAGEKDQGRALFGESVVSAARAVSGTSLLPLEGKAAAFKINLTEPSILHVRTEVPVVSKVTRPAAFEYYELHPQGAALDVYLPSGTSEVALRALLGGVLSGAASFTTSPIAEIREGLGPEVMLSPGTMRVFKFRVENAAAIGVGVRSDSDAVEAVLMNAQGEPITRGVVQMIQLGKGEYLLGMRTPEGAAPARARPALAGITPPHKGPPTEIIRTYLQSE